MLELVVLAEVVAAEGALEYPPAVVPHAALALDAHGVPQRACAGVRGQALLPVADPRLAEVAHGAHHGQTCLGWLWIRLTTEGQNELFW